MQHAETPAAFSMLKQVEVQSSRISSWHFLFTSCLFSLDRSSKGYRQEVSKSFLTYFFIPILPFLTAILIKKGFEFVPCIGTESLVSRNSGRLGFLAQQHTPFISSKIENKSPIPANLWSSCLWNVLCSTCYSLSLSPRPAPPPAPLLIVAGWGSCSPWGLEIPTSVCNKLWQI